MADIFQEFLGLSHSERVKRGQVGAGILLDEMEKKGFSNEDQMILFASLARFFVSADRSCDEGEYRLFIDMTGFSLSRQEFFDLTNNGLQRDFVENLLGFMHTLSEDARSAAAIFGLALASSDGHIHENEKAAVAAIYNA